MSEEIIIAIITGACAVFGQWLIGRQQTAKRKIEEAIRDARVDDKLAGIEERLDTHNRYAERFAEIQTDIAVIKNDVKTLYKKG